MCAKPPLTYRIRVARVPAAVCARPARACCCARDRARRAPGTTAPLAREWRAAAQRACRACDTLCDGLFCFGVKHSGGSARDRFRARPAFLARHSAYCGARGRVGTPTRRVQVSVGSRGCALSASSSADFVRVLAAWHTHTDSATLPPTARTGSFRDAGLQDGWAPSRLVLDRGRGGGCSRRTGDGAVVGRLGGRWGRGRELLLHQLLLPRGGLPQLLQRLHVQIRAELRQQLQIAGRMLIMLQPVQLLIF